METPARWRALIQREVSWQRPPHMGRERSSFESAFLRPGIERAGTWACGNQYIGWHLVETKSVLEGAPNELSGEQAHSPAL